MNPDIDVNTFTAGPLSADDAGNVYGARGSYCNANTICPPDRDASNSASPEEYFISQLAPDLSLQWNFKAINTLSCERTPSGSITCVSDHPHGFEWCVNAPAVDQNGTVYANSQDGNLYAITQGGTLKQSIFQQLALGAAYTPTSIGPDGKIYSQNAGHLFVVNLPGHRHFHPTCTCSWQGEGARVGLPEQVGLRKALDLLVNEGVRVAALPTTNWALQLWSGRI